MIKLLFVTAVISTLFSLDRSLAVEAELPMIKVYDEQTAKIVDVVDFVVDVKDFAGSKVSIHKCTLSLASEQYVVCSFSITKRSLSSVLLPAAELMRADHKKAIRYCGNDSVEAGPECQVSVSGKVQFKEHSFSKYEVIREVSLTEVSMSDFSPAMTAPDTRASRDELPKLSIDNGQTETPIDIIDFVVDKKDYVGASILIDGCLIRERGAYDSYCYLPLPGRNQSRVPSYSLVHLPPKLLKAEDRERLRGCDAYWPHLGPKCRVSVSGKIESVEKITLKDISIKWKINP